MNPLAVMLHAANNEAVPLPPDSRLKAASLGAKDRIFRDYPEFPSVAAEPLLDQIFSQLAVREVRANLFICSRGWRLQERRLGNDLFFYIVSGHGGCRVEGREWALKPGWCAHFPRGARHAAWHDPHDPFQVICFHYSAIAFGALRFPELVAFPALFDFSGDAVMLNFFYEACREYSFAASRWARGLEALAFRLLLHLLHTPRYASGFTLFMKDRRFLDLRRLFPALQWMNSEPALAGPMAELARRCGLSEVHFRRLFQQAMGISPVRYLQRLRIEKACSLLRSGSLTVEAIAAEVGYSETAFFSRSFKTMMGVPPGQYRREIER